MVYCVQAQLALSTAARRDAVLADIQNRIVGKAKWGVETAEPLSFRAGPFGVRVILRFTSNADADDLLSRVETFATGVRLPLAGSWIEVHTCTHDDGTNTCTQTGRLDW